MLFLKWRTCGCFLLVWVNCPPISKGNLEKTLRKSYYAMLCTNLVQALHTCLKTFVSHPTQDTS